MAQLSEQERARGVIAASAGSHAQGVALSASHLQCRAVIVMPMTTPSVKVDAVRQLGGEVVLHGETYDEACARPSGAVKTRGSVSSIPSTIQR